MGAAETINSSDQYVQVEMGSTKSLEESKIELLKKDYPGALRETLKELLAVCEGSVEATAKMIDESFQIQAPKRKARPLYQSSISSICGVSKRPKISDLKTKLDGLSGGPDDNGKSSGKVITLYTPEAVEEYLKGYVSFYKSFFPPEMADEILIYLMKQKDNLSPNEFYLFENYCVSNHSLGFFSVDRELGDCRSLLYNGLPINAQPLNDALERAANYVSKFLNNDVIPTSERLPFQSDEKWECNVCLVNLYEKISNNLDWHSDRLTHIGPHNYIVSASLGATREFRIRKNYSQGDSPPPIYSIVVPHNSMVLMRPGCQEEYKHSVSPLRRPIQLHEISRLSRYNITFRHYSAKFLNNSPKCHCGKKMLLRRSYKRPETRGNYFWSCENVYKNKDCGCFYWADFSNQEKNMIAETVDDCSRWIAPEDTYNLNY